MEKTRSTTAQQRHFRTIVQKVALITALLVPASTVMARGEVELVNTSQAPATPTSYITDGDTYRWGTGIDLKIDSFIYRGKTLPYNPVIPDQVQIVRIDNRNADGTPCAIYAETAGAGRSYQATLPGAAGTCPLAEIISGNVANIGGLDIFTNAGPREYSQKNIERIDLIYSPGIIAPTTELGLAGHTVLEKSGNNAIQVAAILSLDANGQPDRYGPLIKVHEAGYADSGKIQYGITNVASLNDFLSNSRKTPNGLMKVRSSQPETLGFAFISLLDLGIAPGQKYFGISAFAWDVDPAIHELTDPATFPRDTGSHEHIDDADFHLGSGGELQLANINRPPLAQPDTATVPTGETIGIEPLSNDSDPDGDPLQLAITRLPTHGTATITDERIVYSADQGFSGDDFLEYRITDGRGGSSEARISITVTPAPTTPDTRVTPTAVLADSQEAKRIIETGLQGHGAGGLGWILAPLAAIGLRRRALITGATK